MRLKIFLIFFVCLISIKSVAQGIIDYGLILYKSCDNNLGCKDSIGNNIILPIYNDLEYYSDGLIFVKKDIFCGIVDTRGKEILPVIYKQIYFLTENLIPVKTYNDRPGYFSKQGAEIISPVKYDWISSFSCGIIVAKLNNKYGFVNNKGEEITSSKYDYAYSFSDGFAIVKQNGKYGYIDILGKEITAIKFDKAENWAQGFGYAILENKYYKIDSMGNEKIQEVPFERPEIYDPRQFDRPFEVSIFPVCLNDSIVTNKIKYPESAKNNHIEGETKIDVLIDNNGEVIKRNNYTGSDSFEETVNTIVQDLIFIPALSNGEVRKFWQCITVLFAYPDKISFKKGQ
jgi:hypothetical protein